jgi:hypothetical protein
MNIKDIDADLLTQLFEYSNGILIRKTDVGKRFKAGSRAGNIQKDGYERTRINKKDYLNHRLIWTLLNGPIEPGKFIDHINGIKTDNRIENLRIATSNQNNHNSKKSKANTSGIKGVGWNKERQKWEIRIQRKHYGFFDDIKNAEIAVIGIRKQLHGEFANNG